MQSGAKLFLLLLLSIVCVNGRSVSVTDNLKSVFSSFDVNNDGIIDASELASWDYRLSQTEHVASYIQPPSHQIKTVIQYFDQDHSGTISLSEVLSLAHDSSSYYYGEVPPEQLHLSYTADPSQMWAMWITQADVNSPTSTCEYGTKSGGPYNLIRVGTNHTYDVGNFGWYGWIHQVLLTNLVPNTRYYYKCGDPTTGWTPEHSFLTMTALPMSNKTYHYAIMGDMGTVIPMGWAVTDRIVYDNANSIDGGKGEFDMIVHAGDVCYAGTGSEGELEEIWDVWGSQVEPIASRVPYMFAVGNHEHYYNYTSYINRFIMPGNASGGNGNFWWSMDHGYVHWTMMSTEHPYGPGSPQQAWLREDLAKANSQRGVRPWIVLVGHRPMYSSDAAEWDQHRPGAPFQKEIEPLMHEFGVDLYLCGHMHMYERIYPVWNGTVTNTGNVYNKPKGVPMVVQGTAGVFVDWTYIDPKPEWSAARLDYWGYGKMIVYNQTTLQYQFIHQDDGSIVDDFWILK